MQCHRVPLSSRRHIASVERHTCRVQLLTAAAAREWNAPGSLPGNFQLSVNTSEAFLWDVDTPAFNEPCLVSRYGCGWTSLRVAEHGRELGITGFQGFLFAEPLSGQDFAGRFLG